MADHDDLRISMTAAEFLTEAWRLANDKARELGWICLSGFGAMPTTSASGIKRTFAFAKLSQLLTRNGLLIGEIANLASSAMALSISRIDHSVGTQKSIVAARTFRQRDLFCIAALIGSGTSAGSNRL
jgi:hypothetical protein